MPVPKKSTTPRPSSIADWKKRKQNDHLVLGLPSGLSMECDRREVLGSFLQQGMVPNVLMEKVSEHIEAGTPVTPEEAAAMATDKSQMEGLLAMMDNVIIHVAVTPEVHALPRGKQRRSQEKLYVDEIGDEDKMFLFQWATGGTDDLITFRGESRSDMAALLRGQESRSPAKRAGRPRKK